MKNKKAKTERRIDVSAVRKQLAKKFMAFCTGSFVVACASQPLLAQTVVPNAGDTITVTSGTSIQEGTVNGITVPGGTNGVTINIDAGGQVSSTSATAIETSSDTTVNNLGDVAGGFNGVNFVNGSGSGVLSNGASGTVSSDSRAVNIGGAVQITNAGQIIGTGDQRNGTIYSDSVANNFSINNTGTIDAGAGNQGSGVALEIGAQTTADITNSGLIQGRTNTPGVAGGSGLSGDGLRLANFGASGIFDGSIQNATTGEIRSESLSGTIAGLRVANGIGFQGSLDNDGTIVGAQNGLYFGEADHTGGVVNNSGTISSDSRALNIDGDGLTVNNSGNILGTGDQRNGTVYSDGTADNFTFNNTATGVVDAGAGNDASGFAAEVGGAADGANTFTLTNSGDILGRGNGLAGDGVRIGNAGNSGIAEVTATNSGTISSEAANGTVSGFRVVNNVGISGSIDNSGSITGTQNGLYFGEGDHSNGVVNNSGTISSDSRALNIDGDGLTVNNSGDVLGTGNQRNGTIYADGTADNYTFNNTSTGVVDAGAGNTGSGVGAEIGGATDGANTFTLNNKGTIQGRGNATASTGAAGDGVRIGNAGNSGVAQVTAINSGTISSEGANGTVSGVRVVDNVSFAGTLDNLGSISGVQNGVYFGLGDHSNGVVNNVGVISSDSRALNIDGDGLTVNNSGDILATGSQRNGTVYVDGTADQFSFSNSGSVDATGGSGSGVSVQVGSFAGDVQVGQIFNSGSIESSGSSSLDAGIRFFGGSSGVTFSGDITNATGGSITTAGDAAAVLFDSDASFDGSLINDGFIEGSILLNDGDLVLGSDSFLSLEISSLTDFESIETTGSIYTDGILDITFGNFLPTVGQQFDLLDFGSFSGQFDLVQADGVTFDISDLSVGGSVTITAVGVPEPGAFAILGFAGLIASCRRRRNR